MSFSVADPFVIPEDVVLTSVRSLPAVLRRELECEDDDCAITRPHSRTPSRVIDASTATHLSIWMRADHQVGGFNIWINDLNKMSSKFYGVAGGTIYDRFIGPLLPRKPPPGVEEAVSERASGG